jgi:putative endonuclease
MQGNSRLDCVDCAKAGQSLADMQSWERCRIGWIENGLRALDGLAVRRGRAPEIAEHLATGERGEAAAFFYLRRKGLTVVARRWNEGPLPGDLDLIAWDGDVLCFVEVKTRTSKDVATASEAVDWNKRKTLRRLAAAYLLHLPGGDDPEARPETRFDIVTVYELPGRPREVQLIPGAFGWRE